MIRIKEKNDHRSEFENMVRKNITLTFCMIIMFAMLLCDQLAGFMTCRETMSNVFSMAEYTDTNTKYTLTKSGNTVTLSGSDGSVSSVEQLDINSVYPVGSIYTTLGNEDPADLFGGTWERIQGRTLLAAGTGRDADNTVKDFTAGAIGGEYSHSLTTAEMPAHSHTVSGSTAVANGVGSTSTNGEHKHYMSDRTIYSGGGSYYATIAYVVTGEHSGSSAAGSHAHTLNIPSLNVFGTAASVGSGSPLELLSPYLVVNMWKRTA